MKRTVNHFKAAAAMFAAISAAMALPERTAQHAAIRGLEPLKHRGKGKGTPSRVYGNPLGRYLPHQSVRECVRRRIGGFAFRRRLAKYI